MWCKKFKLIPSSQFPRKNQLSWRRKYSERTCRALPKEIILPRQIPCLLCKRACKSSKHILKPCMWWSRSCCISHSFLYDFVSKIGCCVHRMKIHGIYHETLFENYTKNYAKDKKWILDCCCFLILFTSFTVDWDIFEGSAD